MSTTELLMFYFAATLIAVAIVAAGVLLGERLSK